MALNIKMHCYFSFIIKYSLVLEASARMRLRIHDVNTINSENLSRVSYESKVFATNSNFLILFIIAIWGCGLLWLCDHSEFMCSLRSTTSGWKDIGIRKLEFLAKTQFPRTQIPKNVAQKWRLWCAKWVLYIDMYLHSFLSLAICIQH